jgi:hypothetical protein
MFVLASALSDHDLLARIGVLAGKEREATVELVAHLAALDARPSSLVLAPGVSRPTPDGHRHGHRLA